MQAAGDRRRGNHCGDGRRVSGRWWWRQWREEWLGVCAQAREGGMARPRIIVMKRRRGFGYRWWHSAYRLRAYLFSAAAENDGAQGSKHRCAARQRACIGVIAARVWGVSLCHHRLVSALRVQRLAASAASENGCVAAHGVAVAAAGR